MVDIKNRIEVVHITKNLLSNGITNVVMNYTCHVDKNAISSTIISGTPIIDSCKKQCCSHGIDLKEVPSKKKSSILYYLNIWKILKSKKYDIIHIHGNSATISLELILAMLAGIKVRIAHCHNSTCNHTRIHKLMSPLFYCLYTKGYACSDIAGRWLFGSNPYTVIPNGFEIKKFVFDSAKRDEIRQRLNLQGKYVIGNVARFNNQKNHAYLLKIFEKIGALNPDAVLLLVGVGPLLEQIKKDVEKHPFKERILFYGETNHVEHVYNAMDVFVLPSKYEGLGIVFIEAQINGLRCITSDRVPEEVNIMNQTVFLPLENNDNAWVDEILKNPVYERMEASRLSYDEAKEYDIEKNALKLKKDYQELVYK